jgi:PGF-CTERM protein
VTDRTDSDDGSRRLSGNGRPTITRRDLLRAGVVGSFAPGALSTVAAQGSVSIRFEDQLSTGETVTIASIETADAVSYRLVDAYGETLYASGRIPAGENETYTIELERRLSETRHLRLSLYPATGGSLLVDPTATVIVSDDGTLVEGFDVTRIDANPDAGFEYPYFLYAPAALERDAGGPLLVEPNNTGTATDDYGRHREAARSTAEGEWNGGSGRVISDRLAVPFLVPAFPRPREEPVDYTHYTHQLDGNTLAIEGTKLERIDEQLLAMAEDARSRLSDRGYPVGDGLVLNGFSASGNFVNRFAALHPDEVVSVTAGGVNGMGILPRERAKGFDLEYHVGVADVEALTGEPFDPEAYGEVNQFLYMGSLDFNDTIRRPEIEAGDRAYTEYHVYGPDMQRDRFPYTKWAYEQAGIDGTVFRLYEGVKHTPEPALDDIVAFHRRSIAGDPVEDLGGGIEADPSGGAGKPPIPALDVPETVDAGDPVTVDATNANVYDDSLQAFVWRVTDDGETLTTAAGREATISFPESGSHDLRLRVVDGRGQVAETTTAVEVVSPNAGTTESGDGQSDGTETGEARSSTTEPGTTPTDETTSENGPGFGIAAAIAGLGAAAGWLGSRDDEADES